MSEVILNFHGLGSPGKGVPEEERPYWITESRFEAIIDRAMFHHGRRFHVLFTFDDGNQSDLEIGLPLLRRRNCRAKFFVLANRFEAPGYLNAEGVTTLMRAGMVLGTHGLDHVPWSKISQQQLETELDESVRRIQAITTEPVSDVGIPFGAYNRRVLRALRKRPLQTIYTSDGGYAGPSNWIKPRTSVRADTSDASLDQLLTGTLPRLTRLRQRARVYRKSLL